MDTGYVLALLNERDKFYERARATSTLVAPPFVTTEAVLVEIGNALSRREWRSLGAKTLNQLRHSPDIKVVPVDSSLLDRAIALYAARPDKGWGLTDCISFVVMQERSLTHALTTDQHFEQAGFQRVLADP
ncbi:MAG: PIN domain-containing protein [Chloroflexota bacterium]|nr:PIN domain-containing protein [Chloroflexota bacterium]